MKKLFVLIAAALVLFTGCAHMASPPEGAETFDAGSGEYEETTVHDTEAEPAPETEEETLPEEELDTETTSQTEEEDTTEDSENAAEKTNASVTTAHYHDYIGSVTTAASCSSYGVMTYSCYCGAYYTESIPSTAHSYREVVTPPTDYENGYTIMVCSVCGYSDYNRTNIVKAKLGSPEQVLKLVNEERAKQGLAPLEYRYDLQSAADIRANEIMQYFSHTRPDGRTCFTVFEDISFSDYYGLGENIAYGYPDALSVMDGWMNSEGHRANILGPSYTGLVVGRVNNYWVQLFIAG